MAQPMTPALKPGLGLSGVEGAKEGLGGAGQMTSGVEEIEHGIERQLTCPVDDN
jgi:hypothetical protein